MLKEFAMYRIFFAVILFILFSGGCSSRGVLTSPSLINADSINNSDDIFRAKTIFSRDNAGETGNLVMGVYEGVIDMQGLDFSFLPMRNASAIGDSFDVDLTYYLDGVPCGNCLRIDQIAVNADSDLVVTFQVKHPFPAAGGRLDLPVFDVRGIIVNKNPSTTIFPEILIDINSDGNPETPASGDMEFLLNADGYSTFFDIVTESQLGLNISGNLSPYKLFFIDPVQGNFDPLYPNGVDNVNQPRGHNVFRQGIDFDDTGASQDFVIKAGPGAVVNFVFILESSYGQSATFAKTVNTPGQPGSRTSPMFFVPEFNRKEAWKIEVEITENKLVPYDEDSSAQIIVRACDWQAGITPSGDFGPDAEFDDIRYESDVAEVTLDLPGILAAKINQDLTDASGTGSATIPYEWTFDITNETSADPGDYFGLFAVRDEICDLLDGTTPPFGVNQETDIVDFRDFTTYQTFKIEIAGLNGVFQADEYRTNIDLVTGITQPTSSTVVLDLGVVENDDERIEGVYMSDGNNQITRYDLNYTDAVFHGPGLLPPDTEGTHPNPSQAMAIRRLDANNDGITFVGYQDANETFRPIAGEEPVLPAGNILHMFYCIIPPPVPPYSTDFPLDRFDGYWMPDVDDPTTPATNEYEVEDPLPVDVWNGFEDDMGCVWETTKLANPTNGLFDIIYLGVSFAYPPDPADPPVPSVAYAVALSGIPATDIKGCDLSNNGYIYYGLSGPDTPTGSLVVAFDAEDPLGNPIIGGIPITSGNVIDMQLLPYDDTLPRFINEYEQNAPIIVALTDNKTIEFIDAITGYVIQVLDCHADLSMIGDPKHLDIGDRSFTIHVTHLDGTTPRVTVYVLK